MDGYTRKMHKLVKLKKKIVKTESHISFLRRCLDNKIISNGFKIKWHPTYQATKNEDKQFNELLNDTSLKLMENVKLHNELKLTLMKHEEEDLLADTTDEFHERVRKQLGNVLDKLKNDLNYRKCKKWQVLTARNGIEFEAHSTEESIKKHNEDPHNRLVECILEKLSINDVVPNKKPAIPIVSDDGTSTWSRYTVATDGNCFFRAISYALFQTEDLHKVLRNAVVGHMRSNSDIYEAYVDGDFEQHLLRINQNVGGSEIWATEAEIYAMANFLELRIDVQQSNTDEHTVQTFQCEIDTEDEVQVINIRCRNNHYEPLVETNKTNKDAERKRQYHSQRLRTEAKKNEKLQKQIHKSNEHSLKDQDNGIINPQARQTNDKRGHQKEQDLNEATKEEKEIIFNYSKKQLTSSQISLLEKGLKFVTTRKRANIGKILADLREWERRMRLQEYFFDKNKEEMDEDVDEQERNISTRAKIWQEMESRERNKVWMPPDGRDPALDLYIELVKEDIVSGLKWKTSNNISSDEEIALKELMNDDSIIIRPADKGSGIVVMETSQYIEQVQKDIHNNSTYSTTDKDLTTTVSNKVKKLLKGLYNDGVIDSKMKKYMTPVNPQSGIVKANPKVHKKGNPMRVIVSTISHPTSKIAEVVEKELEEWNENLPSYIKDSTHFLQKIEETKNSITPDTQLFTMDIKALYPSVPQKEGLEACREALEKRKNKEIPTSALMEMLELVLQNNNFSFNNKNYVQIDGTAIGSPLGRNFAGTYMGRWEKELLQRTTVQPMVYYRYVDDIFGLWNGSVEELGKFKSLANSIHPRIKVEIEISNQQIAFLDVLVYKHEGSLATTIYTKPTDKHMYLDQQSNHPMSTKNAIPYGLCIRAKRICSTPGEYQRNKNYIINNLHKRGYSKGHLTKVTKRVDHMDREDVLNYRKKERSTDKPRIPLVVTYGNYLPNIQRIVHERMNILHRSKRLKEVFPLPTVTAYRRDANLQDILVHSKYRKIFSKEKEGTNICGRSCAICKFIKVSQKYDDNKGTTYIFKDSINCKTSNCIYGIFCKVCDSIVYVGETGTTLYERFQNHISTIKRCHNDGIPDHFNGDKHQLSDLQILGIEKIYNRDTHFRKVRESFWIKKMNTIHPFGLNKNLGLGSNM